MEVLSLHTLAQTEEGGPLWLTYKLLCGADGRYGVLCQVEGVDHSRSPHSVAAVPDCCGSLEAGEALLRRLARAQVFPQHLPDLIWDFTPYPPASRA